VVPFSLYSELVQTFVRPLLRFTPDVFGVHTRGLHLEILSAEAGMHCFGWLPAGMDDRSLVLAAASHEVNLVPVANFSMEPMERKGILLDYSEYTVE